MTKPEEASTSVLPHTDQTERVRTHFDTVSTEWGDRYARPPQRMSDLDLLLRRENVHRLVRPLLTSAEGKLRVLDVGCGSGDVLDGIGRDRISVLGVDRAASMVARAASTHPADRFMVADATRLPVPDASVDLITSLGVLEYVPDYEAVLASFFRKLRPGGHLIVSFPNRRSLFYLLSLVERSCENAALKVRDFVRGCRREGESGPNYDHRRWTVPEVRAVMAGSGFGVEQVLFNTFGVWGHVGRLRPMLGLSSFLTRNLHQRSVSSWLACTMVFLAEKGGTR